MSEDAKEHRLPPPAFPPGQRRHVHRNSNAHEAQGPEVPRTDPIIAPDEPIPLRRDPIEQAFISPDDPIPERKIELAPEFADLAAPEPGDEGVVVGMDLDDATDDAPSGGRPIHDPHVAEILGAVARLADGLARRGEAGLRADPDMTRFEATLRAYCVGYLAGRRTDEPRPTPPDDS